MADSELSVQNEVVEATDGGCCRITVAEAAGVATHAPVVMLPGMFTGRRFWLSERGIGLAAFLARRGYPAIVVQRRGLSDSPDCDARAGLEEHLAYDLPAVQAVVTQRFGASAFWIGHSFGGVMAARAAATQLDASRIAGLVLFASQYEVGKRMLDWPGQLLTRGLARAIGSFPARAAGLGPENEPIAAMHDATEWVARGRRDPALRESLAAITAPVLAISGAGDRVDPSRGCERFVSHFSSADKTFVTAGRASGYSVDFDHPGIVISKFAQAEIWPRVAEWLDKRAGAD
ncbi:hypothetical protein SADO_05385 [Salinisphaera dokdonensis CL-ES53]|uniref:AB hydrolase-1 domain-containing protein n=1 Tax=Salinisphaera dokdonensis CL-ES53 TaxID=1304272 RepID=A0ABV2AYF3_9GAMM